MKQHESDGNKHIYVADDEARNDGRKSLHLLEADCTYSGYSDRCFFFFSRNQFVTVKEGLTFEKGFDVNIIFQWCNFWLDLVFSLPIDCYLVTQHFINDSSSLDFRIRNEIFTMPEYEYILDIVLTC